MSGGSIDKAREIVDETFAKTAILKLLKGRTFYAVGGTWRNLAKLHMAQSHYALHVLHCYQLSKPQAMSLSGLVAGLSATSLKEIREVSKSRSDTMPFGALVLERLLAHSEAKNVEISVYGVREGLLYAKLPARKRESDALLSSCWDFARRYARSPEHELELCDWTDQIFGPGKLAETEQQRRLRYAACLLADIGWRAHPDYRAERSLSMISQAAFVGIDHPGRVFLALTVFYRYDGEGEDGDGLNRLLDDDAPPARASAEQHVPACLHPLRRHAGHAPQDRPEAGGQQDAGAARCQRSWPISAVSVSTSALPASPPNWAGRARF